MSYNPRALARSKAVNERIDVRASARPEGCPILRWRPSSMAMLIVLADHLPSTGSYDIRLNTVCLAEVDVSS